MRDAFARVLEEEMAQNERIVLITGDLGFGVLRQIHRRFPDRLINAGIAEQGMVSMAAGLAATGRTVLVYSIGNFPVLRPLEQIRNDCVYHKADVKIVCVGGGFVYGSLGMSHHATEDMAVMRAIPDMICYTPGDPAEAEAMTHDMIWRKGTCYLRLGRGNEPQVHDGPVKGWSFPNDPELRRHPDAGDGRSGPAGGEGHQCPGGQLPLPEAAGYGNGEGTADRFPADRDCGRAYNHRRFRQRNLRTGCGNGNGMQD